MKKEDKASVKGYENSTSASDSPIMQT